MTLIEQPDSNDRIHASQSGSRAEPQLGGSGTRCGVRYLRVVALSATILFGSLGLGLAQTQVDETGSPEARLVKNILHDQPAIWTSPVHTKHEDLRWLI